MSIKVLTSVVCLGLGLLIIAQKTNAETTAAVTAPTVLRFGFLVDNDVTENLPMARTMDLPFFVSEAAAWVIEGVPQGLRLEMTTDRSLWNFAVRITQSRRALPELEKNFPSDQLSAQRDRSAITLQPRQRDLPIEVYVFLDRVLLPTVAEAWASARPKAVMNLSVALAHEIFGRVFPLATEISHGSSAWTDHRAGMDYVDRILSASVPPHNLIQDYLLNLRDHEQTRLQNSADKTKPTAKIYKFPNRFRCHKV